MAQPQDRVDQRAREVGRRQSLFREVNEQIDRLAERFDLLDEVPLVCECGSTDCNDQIVLTQAEYETLRRIPTHFAVLPGHDIPDVEEVVARHDGYAVLCKHDGESSRVAEATDPRRA